MNSTSCSLNVVFSQLQKEKEPNKASCFVLRFISVAPTKKPLGASPPYVLYIHLFRSCLYVCSDFQDKQFWTERQMKYSKAELTCCTFQATPSCSFFGQPHLFYMNFTFVYALEPCINSDIIAWRTRIPEDKQGCFTHVIVDCVLQRRYKLCWSSIYFAMCQKHLES